MIKQLLDEVDHDIMDYECRGLSYLPKPKVEDDSIQFTISFTIGRKRTPNFQFFASGTSSSCRLYNNHVKDTRGDGHFMNDLIMSS